MRNQFAGFSDDPSLPGGLKHKLDKFIGPMQGGDPRMRQFVSDAVEVATELSSVPAYLQVTAWRTATSAGIGPGFRFLISLQGNNFYETDPAPPIPAHHRQGGPYRPHHAAKRR